MRSQGTDQSWLSSASFGLKAQKRQNHVVGYMRSMQRRKNISNAGEEPGSEDFALTKSIKKAHMSNVDEGGRIATDGFLTDILDRDLHSTAVT